MNKPNKPNDYFAASLNRPDLSIDQMYSVGLTPNNTGLKDKDYYKDIKQVRDKFTDQDGKFNEEAYNTYYDGLQRSYNEFAQQDFVNKWLSNVESSPYDIFSLDNPNAFDATVRMVRNSDPQRHQMSMSGIGVVGEASWDEREVAQENFVRDQNGNKLDWTPNQKGFFGALTGPTLVLATYDEDGYHEENGREVFHHKGEQKYDENGDPYYELLGDRTIYGKDVLHVTDVISKDGSWFNRNIDFLDSDSLDKSAAKTIFKTAAQIGLFAIPYVGPYLGGIKALMDFSSVLPVFAKSIDGFVTGNNDDPFGKSMSKWEGVMARFDKSQTAHAKESQWSFENVADMLGSSAGQLYSQRVLGETWMKMFSKHAKDLSKLQKTAQNISLGYMALTSAEESYSAFKNAGANDRTAGLGFILTAASMYTLMTQDYFKEWLFKDSSMNYDPQMRFALRDFSRAEAENLNKELGFGQKVVTEAAQKEKDSIFIKRWWNALKNFGENHKKWIVTGKAYPVSMVFANHAFNEGVEEVTEEVTMDVIKALTLGAEALGFNTTEDGVDKLDFGFSPEDMLSRYLTSFVGGALGGAVFEGLSRWENYWKNPGVDSFVGMDAKRRILWYLTNGYEDELKKTLDREYRKGNLGNSNLSWSGKMQTDTAGNATWVADTSGASQNEQMYNLINQVIDTLKYQAESLKIFDADDSIAELAMQRDDVLKQAKLNIEKAAQEEGISVEEYKRKHRTSLMERAIIDSGADTFVLSDIWSARDRIMALETAIKDKETKLRKDQTDSNKTQIDARVNSDPDIKRWRSEQKKAQQDYADILEGKRSAEYIGLAIMLHNDSLRDVYLKRDDSVNDIKSNNDKDLYTRLKYEDAYDGLSESMQEFVTKEYDQYYSSKALPLVREAYNLHLRLLERNDPKLKEIKDRFSDAIVDRVLESETVKHFYEGLIRRYSEILPKMKAQLEIMQNEGSLDEKTVKARQKLQEDIAKIENSLAVWQQAIDSNDVSLLSRAVSFNGEEGSLPFADEIPTAFTDSTVNGIDKKGNLLYEDIDIDDTLDTAIKYFEYLKSQKAVLGYDNPILDNIKRHIMARFRDAIMGRLQYYKQELQTEKNKSDIAKAIHDGFQPSEDGLSVIDLFEQKSGGLSEAERNAKKAGFLSEYRATKSFYIYKKLEDGLAPLTDEEQYYLDNAIMSEDEISKYINATFDGSQYHITYLNPEFRALDTDDTLPLSERTNNFFEDTEEFENLVLKFADSDLDIDTFEQELTALKQRILPYMKGAEERADFEKSVFGLLDDVAPKLKQLEQLKAELRPSPVTDLLKDVYIEYTGGAPTTILDYIAAEVKGLRNTDDLNESSINNEKIRKQLKTIEALIPVLQALIQTSTKGGFNDTVNTFKTGDQEAYTVLDDATIELLNNELSYIKDRIKTLMELSGHAKSNVEQQISVQLNMRPKYIGRFIAHVDQPGVSKKIYDDTEGRINTEQLWKDACGGQIFDEVTDDNYKAYFAAIRKWEKLVHDKFKEEYKTLTAQQLGEKIASFFNIENISSEYNDNPDTVVSDLNLALYLQRIVGIDPNQYYGVYKYKFLKEGQDYPFDGQEMVIGMATAAMLNQEMFNAIISNIKVDTNNAPEDQRDYIENMPTLNRFLAILGGDGTGKSKIVTRKALDMARALVKSTDIVATTAYDRRLQEMKSELDIESDNKLVLLSEIIKAVNGKDFAPEDYEPNTHGHPSRLKKEVLEKLKVDEFDKLFRKDAKLKILVIDEGTFASEAELMAFTNLAEKASVFVLLNGDLNQQTSMREYYVWDEKGNVVKGADGKPEVKISSTGLEDCKYAATPILSESVRVSNQGMRISRQLLRDAVNTAVRYSKENPSKPMNQIIEGVQNVDIALQYHETTSDFAGVKILKTGIKPEDYITKFDNLTKSSDKKPSVGIITDSDKYSAFASDNVEIIPPKAVQGQEYDYVIVDVDLSKEEYGVLFNRLKSINTWISRGKRGVVLVDKSELHEKDDKKHFNFSDSDVDSAIVSVDSKRDHPEQFKQYKQYVNDLYSDVEEINTDDKEGEEPNPEEGGEDDKGGFSDDKGGGAVYSPGKQASDGGDPEAEIDAILEQVKTDPHNSSGYEDETTYAEHHKAISDKQKGLYSLENFYNWLFSSETDALLFDTALYNPFKYISSKEDENSRKAVKVFIQGLAYALSTMPKQTAGEYLHEQRDAILSLFNNVFKSEFNPQVFLDLLFSALEGGENTFAVYTFEQTKDDESLLWFVFGDENNTYKIPLGPVFGNDFDESKIYSDIAFAQKYDLSIISTKGAVHTPITETRFSDKVHLNGYGGIFVPDVKEEKITQEREGQSVRDFFNSKGRFYNIWDLNIFSTLDKDKKAALDFFTPIWDGDILLDFTQHAATNNTRIKGTHKLVKFEKYIELERIIHKLINGEQFENAEDEKKKLGLIKQAFGISDRDVEVLVSKEGFLNSKESVAYNAVKHEVHGNSDLLNYLARANLFSALLRISMRWASSDDDKKSGFASSFLTNFFINFIIGKEQTSKVKETDEGKYISGLKITLTGQGGTNHTVRTEYFVSVRKDGLHIEPIIKKSNKSEESFDVSLKSFSGAYFKEGKLFDTYALTRDLINAIFANTKGSTITYSLNGNPVDLTNRNNLSDETLDQLFANGVVSLVPSKRYERKDPGKDVPKVSYYIAFDSDIANMIPESADAVIPQVEEELRKDPIFKYGMYAIERNSDKTRTESSQFNVIPLDKDSHLTDIGDIMLPGFTVTDKLTAMENTELRAEIIKRLQKDKPVTGEMSDSTAFIDSNQVEFSRPLSVSQDEIEELNISKDVETLWSEKTGKIEINQITVYATDKNQILLRVGSTGYSFDFDGTMDDIVNWFKKHGVEMQDSQEKNIAGTEATSSLRLNKDGFTVIKNNKRFKNPQLIGIRTDGENTTLYFKLNGESSIIPITINYRNVEKLGTVTSSRVNNLINTVSDRGEFILSNDRGTYYLKGNTVIYYENDFESNPTQLTITAMDDNSVTFNNNISITKDDIFEDDEIGSLFIRIQELKDRAFDDSDVRITKFGEHDYKIRNFKVNSASWLMSIAEINAGDLSSDPTDHPNEQAKSINIVSLNRNNITLLLDGKREVTLPLTEDGKNYFNQWIKDKKTVGPNDKFKALLNSPIWDKRFDSILNEIKKVIIDSNSPIDDINEILRDNAGTLGGLYQIEETGTLKQDQSKNGIAWAKLKKHFKNGEIVEITETDNNSYWKLTVINNDVSADYILRFDNGEYVLSPLEQTQIDQQLDAIIESAPNEDKEILKRFINKTADMSLIGWRFNNAVKYKAFFDLLTQRDSQKDVNPCRNTI